jgi:hypothetical protein
MAINISLWQKYFPWSGYNSARGTINKLIEKGEFDKLQHYHATARFNGGVDSAAFTTDVIEDIVHQMYDAKAFASLGAFATTCAKSPSDAAACKKAFLEEADEDMRIGNYEGISEAINGASVDGNTPLSSPDMLNTLMGKVIADIMVSQLEEDSVLYHGATDLLDALFQKSGRLAPQAVIKALRPWDLDDDTEDNAIEVLKIAQHSNLLESVPADAVQALMDYYLAEGMPETAFQVYGIAAHGGYDHLQSVAPDLDKYAFVDFISGTEIFTTLMLRLREQNPKNLMAAEVEGFKNLDMEDLLNDILENPSMHDTSGQLNETEIIADLTALFQHMATQTWGETARIARDVLPQIEEWYADKGWAYPPLATAPAPSAPN